jgi:SAM-dependent methyltransferase
MPRSDEEYLMSRGKYEKTIIAEIYDKYSSEFYDHHAKRGDVEFYVGAAVEAGGAALEIGCGTGRVLIPTAKAGVRITGLDNSREMLKICREKIDGESKDVREQVDLVHGDMRDFDLERQFSLITIPFGPFNYLVSLEEQIRCLECIKLHLNDSGILVVDLWYPDLRELWKSETGADIVYKKTPFTMQDGRRVNWGIRNMTVDYNQQIIQEEMFYDVVYPDGRKEHMVYPCPMRYFFRYEVENLLARTGFALETVYADFDKEPFGSKYPSEMVFIARKE